MASCNFNSFEWQIISVLEDSTNLHSNSDLCLVRANLTLHAPSVFLVFKHSLNFRQL